MGETKKHLLLKEQAKKILKSQGYEETEIFEEHLICGVKVDVAGINEKIITIIECGNLQPKRKELFLNESDIRFIHLPYLKQIKRTGFTIDIDDDVYKEWVELYNTSDKLEYPTLKNFTARKLKEIIKNG